MASILVALLLGIIIGPLARLVLPGKQNISLIMTIVLGALGALAGSWIVGALTSMSGFNWLALIVGVVAAAVLVLIYGAVTGRSSSTTR
ncbi:GlsB/YeaQ/YmgE family stress response membrane protein [Ornithinicoccus halotolerans]|uniref:GlsB/YeaQ/YmgE family stress response membrane protein n=1 Tax=Ornithinicoccus halotolerans TaxID=1748220 RepID=UPI0012962D2A|nr:GlsB/YeaQ/YmgE family stress response membrane protein [Ornithinicoccus halotolerans]